jgi:hypothetical protein
MVCTTASTTGQIAGPSSHAGMDHCKMTGVRQILTRRISCSNPVRAAIAQCCLEVASTLCRLASVYPPHDCRDEQSAEHRPAVERLPPRKWPTSNRNGQDQVGISGRLPSEYEDPFPVQREAILAGPSMDREKTKGDLTPPAITSFSPARSRTSSVQK